MALTDHSPRTEANVRRLIAAQMLKLRVRDTLSEKEEEALASACKGTRHHAARQQIVRRRTELSNSNLLVEGFVARQITLKDGSRQIVALHVPGDFIDLHSFLLKTLEHDIEALTPVTVAIFPHDDLRRLTETQPHLSRMLWLSTLLDAALHREWVVNVGRRRALERVAHLFCELDARLEIIGLSRDGTYALPVTQTDIADACGLTPVHVNRILRELRELGALEFRSGTVRIKDRAKLASIADFDPYYLSLRSIAR